MTPTYFDDFSVVLQTPADETPGKMVFRRAVEAAHLDHSCYIDNLVDWLDQMIDSGVDHVAVCDVIVGPMTLQLRIEQSGLLAAFNPTARLGRLMWQGIPTLVLDGDEGRTRIALAACAASPAGVPVYAGADPVRVGLRLVRGEA